MKQDDNEALKLFIEESREHLSGIEEDFLIIEKEGEHASDQIIDKVFRAIHTLKGSSSYFALEKIKALSHAMESVLGKVRNRDLKPVPELITVLLDGADALRSMVNDIENSEETDITTLVNSLDQFCGSNDLSHTIVKDEDEKRQTSAETAEHFQFRAPFTGVLVDIDLACIYDVQQRDRARFVYLLEIDVEHDSVAKGRSEEELLSEIQGIVPVISTKAISVENGSGRYNLVLCAATIDKCVVMECFTLPAERVSVVLSGMVQNVNGQASLTGVTQNCSIKPGNVLQQSDSSSTITTHQCNGSTPVTCAQEHEKKAGKSLQESSLRVSIYTLDKLMTLAGEMVLTRNELLQNTTARNMQKILAASQRVDSITSELQEAIMSTRMQSIGVVLNKFRRLVRDLSGQLEKKINLEIEGEDVELDKSIIEAVADPLTHIIRNAVDHGIELPSTRLSSGKPSAGNLKIKASHEAGHVVIQIIDDGKGMDPGVIRKKAITMGIADEGSLSAMNDREVIQLIFRPGFSTADKVTEVSGRGVGMDVVQSNLKKVGGAIDIDSVVGKGTILRIKLPLTLAIIPSLLVIVEGERYAIPQANLVELVRICAADVKRKIEMVGGAAVMRLRGELLPLIRVSDVLGLNKTYSDRSNIENCEDRRQSIADRRSAPDELDGIDKEPDRRQKFDRRKSPLSAVNVVVVAAGDFKYGLIVDSLLDSSEIVVKPLGYHLCDCKEYAGATILGDGQVALILDVVGIRRLLEMRENLDEVSRRSSIQSDTAANQCDRQTFLMVENGEDEFFAIPVGLIARIEKIREGMIKTTGGKQAVQYRGGTLRLFSIEDVSNVKTRKKESNSYAVLFQVGGREAGIITSEILDTIDIPASNIDDVTHVQPGIIGSAVVRGSIILILDIFGIVKTCAPELCGTVLDPETEEKGGRILIVEDSVFFLQQIRSFVEDAGFETVCAEDGARGLEILVNNESKIDVVLTDIEMPVMNGLELTRAIRSNQALKDIPVIAVTSVSGEKAERLGREAGVDEYLIKLERDAVLAACRRYLDKTAEKRKIKELV